MSDLTLYQISDEINRLLEIEEPDAEQESMIAYFSGQLERKAEGIGNAIAYLNDMAETARKRAEQFNQLAKVRQNKADRMKEYLKSAMDISGVGNIKTASFQFSLVATSGSVAIDDEASIPAKYKEIVQSVRVDKVALKAALKAGDVPGCHIEPGLSLRIK